MLYYEKYLKYKNKYLQLKKQKGGLRRCNLAIDDVKLQNMIEKQSTAMVHLHGCIIGEKYVNEILRRNNETFIKSTFTIPNNVNIITFSTLNKRILSFSNSGCTTTSVNEITNDFIKKGKKFFKNNNMSNILTSDCIEYFKKYIDKNFKGQNNDITDPNAFLHLRNHIYPSDMNESLLGGNLESFQGIEIISNDRNIKVDIPKSREYNSILGGKKIFNYQLLLSEVICYLFGVKTLSETLKLPHLTIILYSCRGYCDRKLVKSALKHDVDPDVDVDVDLDPDVDSDVDPFVDPSDHVFSLTADLDSESYELNNKYELDDMVLITGTDNTSFFNKQIKYEDINLSVGKIIFKQNTNNVTINYPGRPDYNGKKGSIIEHGDDIKKYSIKLDNIFFPVSVKKEQLIFEKEYKIKLLQNNVFDIQPNQEIKLQNLTYPLDQYNDLNAIVQIIEPNRIQVKINDSLFINVDSSNIDMIPIDFNSSNNFRKLKKVNFDFLETFEYKKNYLYLKDGPNNIKLASSGKVIKFNLHDPNQITIKDSYSQILKTVTIDDIYEIV